MPSSPSISLQRYKRNTTAFLYISLLIILLTIPILVIMVTCSSFRLCAARWQTCKSSSTTSLWAWRYRTSNLALATSLCRVLGVLDVLNFLGGDEACWRGVIEIGILVTVYGSQKHWNVRLTMADISWLFVRNKVSKSNFHKSFSMRCWKVARRP